MPTLIAVIVASVLWVITWAIGLKGFDGFMLFVLIIVGVVTVQTTAKVLPGRSKSNPGGDSGAA